MVWTVWDIWRVPCETRSTDLNIRSAEMSGKVACDMTHGKWARLLTLEVRVNSRPPSVRLRLRFPHTRILFKLDPLSPSMSMA